MCRCFLLVFSSFFFLRWLSTILLVKHFLFLKDTYGKVFVKCEICVIAYFFTFRLASIINISCLLPCTNKRLEASFFSHKPFSFPIKWKNIFFETKLFLWRQSSDAEILLKQILFHRVHSSHCIVNKFKMVLIWWQKRLSEIVFRWIFGS